MANEMANSFTMLHTVATLCPPCVHKALTAGIRSEIASTLNEYEGALPLIPPSQERLLRLR